uniref:C1q domain-containing protein n=1 Tax=Candidatus Kentrum sp. LPFa TaxID=2126335 RepID=A0A450X1R6_9GAMM|nr:MAG: hypothetical protein BECKLPF1236B_GA0070989_13434 [Candidatus Kentron sp. LPFa]
MPWGRRALNTIVVNEIAGASFDAGVDGFAFTLPAGSYFVTASAPAVGCERAAIRLATASGDTALLGAQGFARRFETDDWLEISLSLQGRLDVPVAGAYQVEQIGQTVYSHWNLGHFLWLSALDIPYRIFTEIFIWRLGT